LEYHEYTEILNIADSEYQNNDNKNTSGLALLDRKLSLTKMSFISTIASLQNLIARLTRQVTMDAF